MLSTLIARPPSSSAMSGVSSRSTTCCLPRKVPENFVVPSILYSTSSASAARYVSPSPLDSAAKMLWIVCLFSAAPIVSSLSKESGDRRDEHLRLLVRHHVARLADLHEPRAGDLAVPALAVNRRGQPGARAPDDQ